MVKLRGNKKEIDDWVEKQREKLYAKLEDKDIAEDEEQLVKSFTMTLQSLIIVLKRVFWMTVLAYIAIALVFGINMFLVFRLIGGL
jgi:hypothetical protein